MIALMLKATVVLVLAAALDLGVLRRHGSAAARHLVWTLTVAALLVLPLAMAMLPAWRVVDVSAANPPSGAALADDGARLVQPERTAPASAAATPSRMSAADEGAATAAPAPAVASARTSFDLRSAALAVYTTIALLLLLKVLAEHVMVARLTRACGRIEDADWLDLLASVRASLGVRRDVVLLQGPASVMPLTWGLRRPSVLLPETAASWTQERRRAVLLHEVGHVARHDCTTQTLAAIMRALYWVHPGAWVAARRLRIERELACDELAVSRGIPRLSYAEHLLEIARSYRAPRLTAGAVAMARSRIESRLRSLIDAPRATAATSPRAKVFAALAACGLLLPLAAMAPAVSVVDVTGRWDLRLAARDETPDAGGLVHLALRAPGLNTQYVPLAAFDGLSLDDIRRDAPARFTLRRGPGTFRFEGRFDGARGTGTFVFTPDTRFGEALVARGMARPTEAQLFTLARHGMELDFLDELARQGYPQPTTDLYVRASLTGVDVRVLRTLRTDGRRFPSLDRLISAWNNGEIASAAAPPPPPGEAPLPPAEPEPDLPAPPPAPDPVPAIGAAPEPAPVPEPGAASMPAAPAPVAPPPSIGVPAPAPAPRPETPTRGAWNVTPSRGGYMLELLWNDDTQWRRGFDLAEFTSTPAGNDGTWLIDRDAGRFELRGARSGSRIAGDLTFVPKRAFGQVLRGLGLAPERRAVSDHDLKNLAWGGVGEREVRAFQAQFDALTFNDILDFAVRGVSPAYVESMRTAGVEVRSPRDAVELRFAGVTVADVRALRDAGQSDMSAPAVVGAARRRG